MTVTNDERREVAERLRGVDPHTKLIGAELAMKWYEALCAAVGGKRDPWMGIRALCDRLADLIEPDRDLTCEWVSVDDRLPDCKGEYIVAYHPCCWDNVKYDKVLVGMDSFTGKSSWYRRKYQRVTHWMPKPEPPRAKVVAE